MLKVKNIVKNICNKNIKNIDDFSNIINIAGQKNIINSHLKNIFNRAIQATNLSVRDCMVPAAKMITIKNNSSFAELLAIITNSAHSRFPVVDENNKVLGILLAKDLLNFMASENDDFDYNDYLRKSIIIPENKKLDSLLQFFQFKKTHLMIVVDEYSQVSGLITLEDVLEQIVGEIEDEYDLEEDDIVDYGNSRFLVKATIKMEIFNEYFKTKFSANETGSIAGFVLQEFGYLPKQLEEIKIENMQFKILKADSRKIQLLEIKINE